MPRDSRYDILFAQSPGPIARASYAAHRYTRELDGPDIGDALPFRRQLSAFCEISS